ncbi:MAG: hypothetical protein JNM69_21650 [Archangium sp.]|nr:hypothetical protein [Archangium sp.]
MRLVFAGLLVASFAWADVPSRPLKVGCTFDADCVLTTFEGCCSGNCCPHTSAWLRSDLEQQQRRCAVIDCSVPECTSPCPKVDEGPKVAVCVAGRCEAHDRQPRSNPDFCASDAECVSSTFAGCCGSCCPTQPFAVTRARAALDSQKCRAIRCAAPSCEGIACAQVMPSPIHPVCRGNRCVAERPEVVIPPPPPPVECRADRDCGVDLNPPPTNACWSSPCGCCPTARAVPVEQVRPPPVRRSPTGQGTPFGLSQGNSANAPSCAACPAPASSLTAACTGGRCVLRGR